MVGEGGARAARTGWQVAMVGARACARTYRVAGGDGRGARVVTHWAAGGYGRFRGWWRDPGPDWPGGLAGRVAGSRNRLGIGRGAGWLVLG